MAEVQGRYRLEPARRPGFPWAHLEGPGGVIAAVGRFSALNLFLGRGQRIRTIDGEAWRLRGVSWQRFVCPAVFNQAGLKLATSVPDQGSYAITCRDRGFALLPAEHRPGRPRRWELA